MSHLEPQWIATLKRCGSASIEYPLTLDSEVVLGREATCQIPIQHPTVSRQHAKIQPIAQLPNPQWQVCDLNSSNGTYLNGTRLLGCQILKNRDRIQLTQDGPEFLFEYQVIAPPNPVDAEPVRSIEPIPPAKSPQKTLWNRANYAPYLTLSGHAEAIRVVAFSSDGSRLASGGADKTIKVWDLDTGVELVALAGHKLAVSAVAFGSDQLASGSVDKTIKLWNLNTQEEIYTITVHNMGVNALAFHSEGKILISGSADKTIKLWNLATQTEIRTLTGHKMAVNAVAVHPIAPILASGSADRTVKLWNLESGEEETTLPAFRVAITALAFSPDGQILAIAGDDKTIKLWDLQNNQEVHSLSGYVGQVGVMAIKLDGTAIASGSDDNTIKLWLI